MSAKTYLSAAFVWFGIGILTGGIGVSGLLTRLNSSLVLAQDASPASSKAEYITMEQTRQACQQLGIRDWSKMPRPDVQEGEAKSIQQALGAAGNDISLDDLKSGLQIELEHGQKFPEANITNNHPLVTGKIVVAHIKEFPEYYQRIEVLEIEGDLLKTLHSSNREELPDLCQKLIQAKLKLAEAEARQLRN